MKMKYIVPVFALMGTLAACDDYNDQFDFLKEEGITDQKNLSISLGGSDYGTIADLEDNKTLALYKQDQGAENSVEALAAVKSNRYFTADAAAADYIPAWLLYRYPEATDGSRIKVSFNEFKGSSAYLSEMNDIQSYTLTESDYTTVWGDGKSVLYLSPKTETNISSVLSTAFPSAGNGAKVLVNYAYDDLEPSIGGGEAEEKLPTIGEILATAGEYTVEGTVVATYARGFLLGDDTGSILVYLNAMPNYAVGDKVRVSGTTTKYSGLMQFPNTSEITFKGRADSFAYPTSATSMTGAELDSYVASPSVKYVKVDGKLTISGSYYNLAVDGMTRTGSISYPVAGVVDSSLNDQDVTVTGYLIGGTAKYVYFMVTSVVAKGTTPEATPVGVVAMSAAGTYTVKGTVAAIYARGFLLTDGTGRILVYKSSTGVAVGDVVTVSGATSAYAGLMQYSSSATVTIDSTGGTYSQPAARELSTADCEAYLDAPYCAMVTYIGTLAISGNYYNITIDGTTKVQGSISYPNTGDVDASLDKQKVTVTGYAIGTSSSKYLNTMLVSIAAASSTSSTKALASKLQTRAASSEVTANKAALYTYNSTDKTWSKYSTSGVTVAAVNPQTYTSVGTSFLAKPDTQIPTYLNLNYPYATNGAVMAVAYVSNLNGDVAVSEYKLSQGAWKETSSIGTSKLTFQLTDGVWTAGANSYYENTLLGSTGDFTACNVALNGLTYVWTNTTSYGWKGSAYASKGYAAEAWLVSPVISLEEAEAPVLNFAEAANYMAGNSVADVFTIWVTADADKFTDDVSACNWTQVVPDNRAAGDSWTFVDAQADLSSFAGESIRIAFKYVSYEGAAGTWEVKNVSVAEPTE